MGCATEARDMPPEMVNHFAYAAFDRLHCKPWCSRGKSQLSWHGPSASYRPRAQRLPGRADRWWVPGRRGAFVRM